MKRNARTAYQALLKIGAPVFDKYNGGEPLESGHFAICGEQAGKDDWFYPGSKDYAADGFPWADYYNEWDPREEHSVMGVHNSINEILEANDLYAEWYDAGSLRVYDA